MKEFIHNAEIIISQCRPGDWEHAKRVANYIDLLSTSDEHSNGLLTKAAYIHDIGWYKVLPNRNNKITREQLIKYEKIANIYSIPNATKFLEKQDEKVEDIREILKLIKAADNHKSSNNIEAIIVDADLLSKLDIKHFKEKYVREEWEKMLYLI